MLPADDMLVEIASYHGVVEEFCPTGTLCRCRVVSFVRTMVVEGTTKTP